MFGMSLSAGGVQVLQVHWSCQRKVLAGPSVLWAHESYDHQQHHPSPRPRALLGKEQCLVCTLIPSPA